MATVWYTNALYEMARGNLVLDAETLRVLLVQQGSSVGTEDPDFLGGFSNLLEADAPNYARRDVTNPAIIKNVVNGSVDFDADDVAFPGLDQNTGGTNNMAAVVYASRGGDDPAQSIPVAYHDAGGFPFSGNGVDATVKWNQGGFARIQR